MVATLWYEWVFDGIGTELIVLIVGFLAGTFAGYKLGIRKNGLQKQIAKDEAKQEQRLETSIKVDSSKDGISGNTKQVQRAGKKAEQRQIGTIK
ncbi:MAG: hypothetical protein K6E85_16495 [Lachnospiraceae bacterium]|nr:hypothetical protein [Lachnospiraceae bacterium]